ncbi:hypothetical protein MKX03_019144 [Papaver bracteatum]|nr:hypothetical protein MKX03_019144 [Papaver bracteatum]
MECASFVILVFSVIDRIAQTKLIPHHARDFIQAWGRRFFERFYPYVDISFDELVGSEYLKLSRAYSRNLDLDDLESHKLLEAYLGPNSSETAKRMRSHLPKKCKNLSFVLEEGEEIVDEFAGIQVWWRYEKEIYDNKYVPERKYLRLQFHKKDRKTIKKCYLDHILKEGKKITKQNSYIKLYSNNPISLYDFGNKKLWGQGEFDHPVSFKHIAMDPKKKQEIIDDLIAFNKGKDYYGKIGKPWKRGYLLHGPPGTGKSSLIAAMANLLEYDVYDFELTAVKDNSDLRKLLQNTTNKSIMVSEDIDCSLDLTGKRKDKKKKKKEEIEKEKGAPDSDSDLDEKKKKDSDSDGPKTKVTLSGLLNLAMGYVFTTNHVDKLDPALIRRGRMDKHIEMSYCCFESFKILAKNYLDLDSHELFETIRLLIGEIQITPADVAEHLMPKTPDRNAKVCLKSLIQALENAKAIKVLENEKGTLENAKEIKVLGKEIKVLGNEKETLEYGKEIKMLENEEGTQNAKEIKELEDEKETDKVLENEISGAEKETSEEETEEESSEEDSSEEETSEEESSGEETSD